MRDPINIEEGEYALEPFMVSNLVADGPNGSSIHFGGPVTVRAVYREGESVPLMRNDIWIHKPDTIDRILLVAEPDPKTGVTATLFGRGHHAERMNAAWDVIEYLEKYQHKYEANAIRRLFGIPKGTSRA